MIIRKDQLEKIRRIIEKQHKYLLVAMLGQNQAPGELKEELSKLGMKPKEAKSFLELVYHHNYLNDYRNPNSPHSHAEMKAQQAAEALLPKGAANDTSKDYLHTNLRNYIQKQSAEVTARIESIIQETNNSFKFADLNDSLKGTAKSKLKTVLKDYSKDATRNWDRIVNTEVSNAISLGSADRISEMNSDKSPDEVYVYRIVVNDAALCKYCRKFYLDKDNSPKLYRLSTILGNGSNFGKKASDWLPVAMATHPNERCSPLLELKPGWKLLPGGGQAFVGFDGWDAYLKTKLIG